MKKILLSIIFLCVLLQTIAQTGTIRGFATDLQTGEPIMFCNVSISGTKYGSQTDLNGMYTLSKIPEGEYTLSASYIGYNKVTKKVKLVKGEILTFNFELSTSSVKIQEVEISAERLEMKTEVKAASIKITNEDLKLVPTIGGEPDLAQYMQIIPGVFLLGIKGVNCILGEDHLYKIKFSWMG